jgi:hypothetical protein
MIDDPLVSLVDDRMQDLQRMLLYAGIDMSDPGALLDLVKDDPDAMSELSILSGEVRWQLQEIIHEVHRRMAERTGEAKSTHSPALEWIARNENMVSQN